MPLACVAVLAAMGGVSGVALAADTGSRAVANETAAPAVSKSVTATRTEVAVTPGTPSKTTTTVVASETVKLTVSQTTNLQGRQEIAVSWQQSGDVHPTGGIVADQNSVQAQYQEYPMVLLECRDTPAHTDQPTPETCWTQSWTERYQASYTRLEPYQLDRYQTTPGATVVGQPATLPTTTNCKFVVTHPYAQPVRYWVPWLAASGQVYAGGTNGGCGVPPESNGGLTSALPSNETFGVTATDGTGSTDFDVFTSAENTTLGCSSTVACSLVAVPIVGISCDGALPALSSTAAGPAALASCEAAGHYSPGAVATTSLSDDGADLAVTGSLWWSPSNWRNHITVPLTFDPPSAVCSLVGGGNSVSIYGSELMVQATSQWAPSFCTGTSTPFSLNHVAMGEPEARDLLASGGADAAFTSYAQTGGYSKPVVDAPVAVTGFTISFAIDGADGKPITTLKLTPLLLAKLLTESYPDLTTGQGADPALANNPLNITEDPEFQELNPGVPVLATGFAAASELVSISSDSDVMDALTTYINDTPAARAWLDGTPDNELPGLTGLDTAWSGMVVNPAYKGMQLPINQWPLLSTYESSTFDNGEQVSYCLQASPEPLYSLIAAPVAALENVSESMQFDNANSTVTCSPDEPDKANSMVASGRQSAGHYFMIGITPLADDERYNLQAAQLQTTTGTFVAPTTTSLEAATKLLTWDATTGTWPIPYTAFQTAKGASAYPGTMVVYTAVPTSGLSTADATDLAAFLQFAVTTGQTPGLGVGQLPPGYLPMTAANGLGTLVDYTQKAATEVADEATSTKPAVSTPTPQTAPATPTPAPSSPSPSPTATAGPPSSTFRTAPLSISPHLPAITPVLKSGTAQAPKKSTAAKHRPRTIWLGRTLDVALWTGGLWSGGVIVVLVLALALVIVLLTPLMYLAGRRRGKW